jgi:hypothetical protein
MMKFFLILSITVNLLIALFFILNSNRSNKIKAVNKRMAIHDFEITSTDNFESVFIEKNDSVYGRIWNDAFQNQPEKAFLISCSYFLVTKNQNILKDIEISESQLETMYHKRILVDTLSWSAFATRSAPRE